MNNDLPELEITGETDTKPRHQPRPCAQNPILAPKLTRKTCAHEKFRYQTRESVLDGYPSVENKGPGFPKPPNSLGSILRNLRFGGPFLGFGNPKTDLPNPRPKPNRQCANLT